MFRACWLPVFKEIKICCIRNTKQVTRFHKFSFQQFYIQTVHSLGELVKLVRAYYIYFIRRKRPWRPNKEWLLKQETGSTLPRGNLWFCICTYIFSHYAVSVNNISKKGIGVNKGFCCSGNDKLFSPNSTTSILMNNIFISFYNLQVATEIQFSKSYAVYSSSHGPSCRHHSRI